MGRVSDLYIEQLENMSEEERWRHEEEQAMNDPEVQWQMMLQEKRESGDPVWGTDYGLWIDAKERAKEFPDTFEVPSDKEINNINIGDFVKVGCEWSPSPFRSEFCGGYEGGGERFYVQVVSITTEKRVVPVDRKRGMDQIYVFYPYDKVEEIAISFKGIVNNELISPELEDIRLGDLVQFYPQHVLSILTDDDISEMHAEFDENPDDYIKKEIAKTFGFSSFHWPIKREV